MLDSSPLPEYDMDVGDDASVDSMDEGDIMSKGSWTKKFAWLPTRMGYGWGTPLVFLRSYRERVSADRRERLYRGKKYKVILA